MSQNVNLYQIKPSEFENFSANPDSYDFHVDESNSAIFEQNFEGLNFIFSIYFAGDLPEPLQALFYPEDYIGDEIDYEALDFDEVEDFPESTATYFLSPEVIFEVDTILKDINSEAVLRLYDAENFNNNDVYPIKWHTDESPEQAFNKRHLAEGLKLLQTTISDANSKGNYILYFSG